MDNVRINKKYFRTFSVFLIILLLFTFGTTAVFAAEGDVYLKQTGAVEYTASTMQADENAKNHVSTLPELFTIEISGRLYEMTSAFEKYNQDANHWRHLLILPDARALVSNAEDTLSQTDLHIAQSLVNDLTIDCDRMELQERLDLVQVKINLATAKSNAGEVTEVNYTVASWEMLKSALNLPEDTVDQKINKTNAIYDAISGLEEKAIGQALTIGGYEGVYDGNSYSIEVGNLIHGDTIEYSWDGGSTWVKENPLFADVGKYSIDVKVTNQDFKDREAKSTVVITPKVVKITVNSFEKTYGEDDPTFDGTIKGLIINTDLGEINFQREIGEGVGNYEITASYTDNPNYIVRVEKGHFEITKAATSSFTIADKEVTYDGLKHSVEISETQKDDIITYKTDTDDQWTLYKPIFIDVGNYTVFVKATNPNYLDREKSGTVVINPKEVTIRVNSSEKIYGTEDPEFSGTVEGLIKNSDLEVTYERKNTEEAVKKYYNVLGANYSENKNYMVNVDKGDFEIRKAAYDLSGFSFNDETYTYDGLTKSLGITGNLPEGISVSFQGNGKISSGEYIVKAIFTGDNHNYEPIPNMEATLKIEKAEGESLFLSGHLGIYDGNPHSLEVDNLLAGDKIEYRIDDGLSWVSQNPIFIDVGVYTVEVKISNPNYIDREASSTVVITPKKVTLTVIDAEKVYGDPDPSFVAALEGLVGEDILDISYERVIGENVGDYVINASYTTNANYDVTVLAGVFTIKKATYKLDNAIFSDVNDTYDGTFKSITVTGDLPPGVTVTYVGNDKKNAGEYKITAKFNGDETNYDLIPDKTATLIINKAPITIIAEEKTSIYGEDIIELTYMITDGEIYKQDDLNITLTKSEGITPGNYIISLSAWNDNYDITLVDGTYIISKSIGEVLDITDYSADYDGKVHSIRVENAMEDDIVSFRLPDGQWSETNPLFSDAGEYKIEVKVTNPNYEERTGRGTVTIAKKTLTITGNSSSEVYDGTEQSLEGYEDPVGLLEGHVLSGVTASASGTNAGEYSVLFDGSALIMDGNVNVTNNYNITLIPGILTIEKSKLTIEIIKIGEDYFQVSSPTKIVERDYKDNKIKSAVFSGDIAPEGKTLERISLINIIDEVETDITHEYILKFYKDSNKEFEITELDLSRGGSTYKLYIEAISENGNYYFSDQVIFKYKSVTIGNNETYYTIEDALDKANSGTVIVKHNTSFAEKDLAEEIYAKADGSLAYEVKEKVTLLLPHGYDDESTDGKITKYSTSITDKFPGTGTQAGITKNSPYVQLLMPKGIHLDVNGILTVNALRSGGTPIAGQIVGSNYSQLQMMENSKITVNSGGKVNSIGFVYGHGSMEAKSGATIVDSLLVTGFRGGTKTTVIYEQVFPFDQFSFHNIEVPLTINSGAFYDLSAIFNAGGEYVHTSAPLIGNTNLALISLNDGKIIKSYEPSTGRVILDFYSQSAQINNLTLNIVGYIASTVDKEMPFPGNFQLNVKEGSTITMKAGAKLLPGAGLHIEKGATAIITENARLMVYGSGEYSDLAYAYPRNSQAYYRVSPEFGYSAASPAKFIVDGTLIVQGGLAGEVVTVRGGEIQIASTALTQLTINSVDNKEYGVIPSIYYLKDSFGRRVKATGDYRILADNSWVTDITFHKNDGSGVKETITQTYDESYIFPEWIDESITWYNDPSQGEPLNFNKVDVVSQNLYARREIITHTITFETNGGKTIDPYQISTLSTVDLNNYFIPVKEGSVFLGWYTDDGFTTRYDSGHVVAEDLTVYARWAKGSIIITITPDKTDIEKEGTITVTAKVEDEDGSLENLDIEFINTLGSWENGSSGVTDENGTVTKTFTSEHDVTMSYDFNDTISVREAFTGTDKSIKINVKAACPLIYSFNGRYYYLEHEPVPYSIAKNFETISFGTFSRLIEVNGKYYIRIAEDMNSETFVNGVRLYAVDYMKDSGIMGVFVDIFGVPHTIKGRVLPKAFVDFEGKSLLEYISQKGKLINSDTSQIKQGRYLDSYEAVFDRPDDAGGMAKFMIKLKANPIVDAIAKWFYSLVDGQNNIWWLGNVLELSPHYMEFMDAMNVATLGVELWDGEDWISQGEVAAGSTLLEEFLIPLDLSLIKDDAKEIKVRLRSGIGFFKIDQVSMDFSEDEEMKITRLDLDSALKNETDDVKEIIEDLDNDQRVSLQKGENIDLYYDVPELKDGYERGFVIDFKGYFQVVPNARKNSSIDKWGELTYEEAIDTVLKEQPEAKEILQGLDQLYELAELIAGEPLEYKIEKILFEQVIPWLDAYNKN